jgi:predicted HTH transcriptional regulator
LGAKIDGGLFWKFSVKTELSKQDILSLLDCDAYFALTKLPLPNNINLIIERFEQEGFIIKECQNWAITNLGALLLAKDIRNFSNLAHKTARVITYDGDDRLSTVVKDIEGKRGYAAGFEDLINWIDSQIPEPQKITKVFRQQNKFYPDKAIRELVANALIHQDFLETGMRPIIEIYKNHIDISNPGNCLVNPERIIGAVPKARNDIGRCYEENVYM